MEINLKYKKGKTYSTVEDIPVRWNLVNEYFSVDEINDLTGKPFTDDEKKRMEKGEKIPQNDEMAFCIKNFKLKIEII